MTQSSIRVVMPQMGESLAEGTLVRWLKAPGDLVARDEPLFEISTDKVDTDVPSPSAGVLREVLVAEGQTVAVGTALAVIETPDSGRQTADINAGDTTSNVVPGFRRASADSESKDEPAGHFRQTHAPQLVSFKRADAARAPDTTSQARTFSPAVLETARRSGMPLETLAGLRGSGRGGRITKRDIEAFLRGRGSTHHAAPVPHGADANRGISVPPEYLYRPADGDQIVPMSVVRKKIAHHMSWSVRISPHASAFAECDMSRAARLIDRARPGFEQSAGAPLTYTVLAAHAAVAALREFPVLNASVLDEALALKPHVNLGIAVALADAGELIVPVIREADGLSMSGLARAVADLAGRARERRLRPDDVQGGTFTLTNPGIFGGVTGTPVLNQPQVAILGLGAVTKRAVVVDDAIAIRPVMTMSLTFDHRAADGMVAFRYLARVKELLEGMNDSMED